MAFWRTGTGANQKEAPGPYVLWKTAAAKQAGIVADVRAHRAHGGAVILVAHFTDTLAELADRLDRDGLAWEPLTDSPLIDGVQVGEAGPASVYLLHSDLLTVEALPVAPRTGAQPALVAVAEMHGSADRCARVGWFAEALPFKTRLRHHVAMDDPFLRPFVGEAARILSVLGMKDDENITHTTLDAAVNKARQKVLRAALSDHPAETAEQWLQRNCPDLERRVR